MEDKIKKRLQELCPDVNLGGFHDADLQQPRLKELTLAVVLLAIEKTIVDHCIFVSASGRFYEERAGQEVQLMAGKWNLEKDNWDDQDRPTQLFVGSLLGITN